MINRHIENEQPSGPRLVRDSAGFSELAKVALAKINAERVQMEASGSANGRFDNPCAAALAYALCDRDDGAASAIVDDVLGAGVSVKDVCLGYLAPAARHLGELWMRDMLPFSEVTLATGHIQSILHRLPASRAPQLCLSDNGAIFAAVPGETHTLGVVMAADLFRRKEWDVSLLLNLTHDALVGRIASDDRPLIGLSCSGQHSLPALKSLVEAIVRVRPDADIIVSGQIAHDADAVASLGPVVTVVMDSDEAEVEMARIMSDRRERNSDGAAERAGRRRASSAA
ncbi:MAG: cobalamin B12-binding domain-containing protein [Roseicyclus sp.]